MKTPLRVLLTAALIAVFLVSTAFCLRSHLDKRTASKTHEQALMLASALRTTAVVQAPAAPDTAPTAATQAPPETDAQMQQMQQMDLSALQKVNPQVIGWIRIPGTEVDHPLMQGEDNRYYLTHTWDGKRNSVGAIFMDNRNKADFSNFNTLIYGHNMNDGSMFASIRHYKDEAYWQAHPHVYILCGDNVLRGEVFSAYRTSATGEAYTLGLNKSESRVEFIEAAVQRSVLATGIVPTAQERIVTLSTCIGSDDDDRWVVHARIAAP